MLASIALACTGLALFAAAMTAVNLILWPRGRPGPSFDGRVSILIPARNEAGNIAACVAAALDQRAAGLEVLVYDDASEDDTPKILARMAASEPRLRVLRGGGLPAGWVGKPHACHGLARAASGDVLLFIDADTRLKPGALERAADLMRRLRADVLSAFPEQRVGSFFERLVLPFLQVTYTSWFPLPLIWRSRNRRFMAANGQLLVFRRDAYEAIGGFAAVRAAVVDDMAICSRAKALGRRVVFADGFEMAWCRMYGSAREVVRGFSKNLAEGLGGPIPVLAASALYLGTFFAPFVFALLGACGGIGGAGTLAGGPGGLGGSAELGGQDLALVGAIGALASILIRAAGVGRFRQPPEGLLLHPVAVLAVVGIALNSLAWQVNGRVEWRGRTYGAQAGRRADTNGVS